MRKENRIDMETEMWNFSDPKLDKEINEFEEQLPVEKGKSFRKLVRQINTFHNINRMEEVSNSMSSFMRVFGRTKLFFTILMISFIGFLVGALFSYGIVKVGATSEKTSVNFVPNSIAVRKPAYMQLLKTQEEVDLVKKSNIRDAYMASIGATVDNGKIGLTLIPAKEMTTPTYHLKEVGVQTDKIMQIGNYKFIPNALFTKDPIFIQILFNNSEVEIAKHYKNLHDKDLLEVGAAITASNNGYFVTAKATLETKYSLVKPIDFTKTLVNNTGK